jgi:hypothetical protein
MKWLDAARARLRLLVDRRGLRIHPTEALREK